MVVPVPVHDFGTLLLHHPRGFGRERLERGSFPLAVHQRRP
jgi:hypothetical protein